MSRTLVFAALASFTLSAPSIAQTKQTPLTKEQINVINLYANASALSLYCPTMQIDEKLMLLSVGYFRIGGKDNKAAVDEEILRAGLRAQKITEPFKNDPDLACAAARVMFGPKGTLVPDLMIKR